ncbi:MAG: M48 family metallopeptidase [Odoribacter splanchnicus]
MKNVNALRHGKEKTYFTVMLVVSVIIWLLCSIAVITMLTAGLPILLMVVFVSWLSAQYFKAVVFGNSVRVHAKQFPEIHQIVAEQARELGISKLPTVFIENGNGTVNAFAVKMLSKKYIILKSDLVDLMLRHGKTDELAMIIGHELAHHAAGHLSFFRNLLIFPGRIIPFIGGAYGRACELTADRIGYSLVGNKRVAENALITLALGAQTLKSGINVEAFIEQETDIPEFMGFIHKLFSSHPRMTRRVIEIEQYNG